MSSRASSPIPMPAPSCARSFTCCVSASSRPPTRRERSATLSAGAAPAAPAPEAPAVRVENAGGATNWNSTIVSLEQLGYLDGFTLEGDQGRRALFFPMPPGVPVGHAALVFDIEFSELLIPSSS